MDTDSSLPEIYQKTEEELHDSVLLNQKENHLRTGELVPLSLASFFMTFFGQKRIYLNSFVGKFGKTSQYGVVFPSGKLIYKDSYEWKEVQPFVDKKALKADVLISTLTPYKIEEILLPLVGKDDLYLGFLNILYQQKGKNTLSETSLVYYPITLEKDEKGIYLVLKSTSVLENKPLALLLKEEEGLDFTSVFKERDPLLLADKTEKLLKDSKSGADRALHIYAGDFAKEVRKADFISMYPSLSADYLVNLMQGQRIGEEKKRLLNGTYIPYVTKALDEMEEKRLMRITSDNPFNKEIIISAIREALSSHGSVLFVVNDKKEQERVQDFLAKDYFHLLLPYRRLDDPSTALFTLLESKNRSRYSGLDSDMLMVKERQDELRTALKTTCRELSSVSLINGESILPAYKAMEEAKKRAEDVYDFSEITDYSFDDSISDHDFLVNLDKSAIGKTEPFTSHPFYGLNSEVKEDDYPQIIDFLHNMIDNVTNLENAIEKARVKESGWSDFNSLKDYDEAVNLFSIYAKYENYPEEYFKIGFTNEILDQIKELEDAYRTEASILLSFDMLCKPEVRSMDLKKALSMTVSRKTERELKKRMRPLFKITPFKKSYKTFIVLADKYVQNHDKVVKLQTALVPVFGTNALSLDGLLFVDKSLDFVESYKRHVALFDHLNFKNPFTEAIFHDVRFSEAYRTVYYPGMMEARSVLENNLDKFHYYFNEDKFDYSSASFTEIKERLSKKVSAKREDFNEFLKFSKKADAASKCLRAAINEAEEKDGMLTHFNASYTYSIYRYYFLKAYKENNVENLLEEKARQENELFSLLEQYGNLDDKDYLSLFSLYLDEVKALPSYDQTILALKNLYHENAYVPLTDALEISSGLFFTCFPIYIVEKKELQNLEKVKFTLTVYFGSEEDEDVDFVLSLHISEHFICLGEDKDYLLKYFSEFKTDIDFDLSFLENLNEIPEVKEEVRKVLLSQKKETVSTPFPLSFEFKGKTYNVFYLDEKEDPLESESYFLITDFYQKYFSYRFTALPLLAFLLYPERTVLSLYQTRKSLYGGEEEKETNLSSYEERRKDEYFNELNEISKSFELYEPGEEKMDHFYRSTLDVRPLSSIPLSEIEAGILEYLSHFTYLVKETLIREMAKVIGTDERDIDFRQMFERAQNELLEKKRIRKDGTRLALVRL